LKTVKNHISSSFRDPSGFLFVEDGKLFRTVNHSYQEHYEKFIHSGLYNKLIEEELLIPHKEVQHLSDERVDIYKIIQPEIVPFISYPYEWCFSQYKDTALTLLKIMKIALDHDMVLKDASAYNMQFYKGKPVLIDTLSFEIYGENQPWVAYRQFCQHFLAPLSLMAYRDVRLNQLMRIYIDGIPLDLVSKLLPFSTRFKHAILLHIHMHARAQKQYESKTSSIISHGVKKQSLVAMTRHLKLAIEGMQWHPVGTEWGDYYKDMNYSKEAFDYKKCLVEGYIKEINPEIVWDLGANTGLFSRLSTSNEIYTIAFDIDPGAVEINYLEQRKNEETMILPLCIDLTNPSPAIGWANKERYSLIKRGPADMALALALIHHLAISNNLSLSLIAEFLNCICRFLIIEFVSKNDSQVQRLLKTRKDIFYHYDQDHFEAAFSEYFSIVKRDTIVETQRVLYLMKAKVI
jgi:hypothetical protein